MTGTWIGQTPRTSPQARRGPAHGQRRTAALLRRGDAPHAGAGPPHRLARSAPREPRLCWATAAIAAADLDTVQHAPLTPADRSQRHRGDSMRTGALMRMARA
ncbi:hypothetical protein BFX40_10945 [Mesorhizobium sp. SEMIA 3007]|nr:hypothetical protein BFX40_10945 [Mesorhizobium sp. SEMIA 3007]